MTTEKLSTIVAGFRRDDTVIEQKRLIKTNDAEIERLNARLTILINNQTHEQDALVKKQAEHKQMAWRLFDAVICEIRLSIAMDDTTASMKKATCTIGTAVALLREANPKLSLADRKALVDELLHPQNYNLFEMPQEMS